MAELEKDPNALKPGPRVGKEPPVKKPGPNPFEGQAVEPTSIPTFIGKTEFLHALTGSDNFIGAMSRKMEYIERVGENGVGTAFTDGYPAKKGYRVIEDPIYQENPHLLDALADSRSPEQSAEILREHEATVEAAYVLAQDPRGEAAKLGAHMMDPTFIIPPMRVVKGSTFLKRSAKAFGVTMAAALPSEMLISSENPTRDFAEAMSIATTVSLFAAPLLALPGRNGGRQASAKLSDDFIGPTRPHDVNAPDFVGPSRPQQQTPRDLGAAAAPEAKAATLEEELADEALVATGFGLEKLPWNPVFRMAQSASLRARQLSEDMVDSVLLRNKNLKFKASGVSVETSARVRWSKPLIDALKATDEQFLLYRGKTLGSELGNQIGVMRTVLRDGLDNWERQYSKLIGEPDVSKMGEAHAFLDKQHLTAKQFREEVAHALRNNDTHHIPEVQAAARAQRPLLDKLKKEAFDQDLFTRQMRREVGVLERRIASKQAAVAKAQRGSEAKKELVDELADLLDEVKDVEAKIARLNEFGPTVNTSPTYFPRYYDRSAIEANRQALRETIREWLIVEKHVDPSFARGEADDIIDNMLMESAYFDLKASKEVTERAEASAFRERTLEIPDNLIRDFLVNDVETVMRHHTRTVGMDIELTAKFGDIDMAAQIKHVTEEYAEAIAKASAKDRAALRKQLKRDVRDIEALRDRLRGTYGVPEDPFRLLSRTLRVAKTFNVLTMMGGAAITSTTDLARFAMVDGFGPSLRAAAKLLRDPEFRKLHRAETRELGQAMDLVNGTRAMQMADIADTFGNRMGVEKALLGSAQMMFTVNGLNAWNTMMKEVASVVVATRVNKAISAVAADADKLKVLKKSKTKFDKTDATKGFANAQAKADAAVDELFAAQGIVLDGATKKQISNLAASGIDENMALRISDELGKYGEKIGDLHLPNTSLWKDANAAFHYRAAISQDIDRIISTPGAGDRALWTSTEWGSTIAQFKSFGQGFFQRGIVRGLQEPDANLLAGTGSLIAMGFLVNEVKAAIRGDDRERSFGVKVMDAVERSGALGWVSDADNALETISNGRLGLRPFTGTGGRPTKLRDLGNVLGPSFSTAMNVSDVVGSSLQGETNTGALRRLTPFQNHPVSQLGRQAVTAYTRPTSPKEN